MACGDPYNPLCPCRAPYTIHYPSPYQFEVTAVPYYTSTPEPASQGWQCPKCSTIHAPFVAQCGNCAPAVPVSTCHNQDQVPEGHGKWFADYLAKSISETSGDTTV